MYKGTYLMRDMSTALQSLAPRDKFIFLATGTLAGGLLDVDVSDILNNGANPHYVLLNSGGTVTAGVLAVDNLAIGDAEVVTVLVICDQKDLKMDG
jgi:hypothetical protein